MRKMFITLLILLLSVSAKQADAIVVVINTGVAGTPISSVGPVMLTNLGSYKASRYAYLYTQAELAAAGITSGATITDLGWMKSNAAPTTGAGTFRIYMKNSAAIAYAAASETWANLNTGATMVYQNTSQLIPATASPTYIDFTLNTPFVYTGDAVEISVEWDVTAVAGNPGTGELLWMWSTVPDRIYGACNTTMTPLGTLSSTTSNTTITDRRPFIQITYTPGIATAPGCVATPTAPANSGTACAGSTTLSWPAVTGATGYDVYLNTGATATTIVSTNQPGTTYTATIAAGPYAWKVVPQNSIGSATGCANFTFTGTAAVTPSVTITANPAGAICAGTPVTFAATPVNGGASPFYQWKKNGLNVGANSASYTDNTLANSDVIFCEMTSNALCAGTTPTVSNSITMAVNATLAPSIVVSASPGSVICAGSTVTFTATPINGGGSPSYQWKVDGVNAGANSSTFTTSTFTNGNVVTCVLTSSASCASPSTVTSMGTTMTVNPAVVPTVAITANPGTTVALGQTVTFTASPVNGGSTPVYQWKKNGLNVGTNTGSYITSTLVNNDMISVELQSNAPCASPALAVSNVLTITITGTAVSNTGDPLSDIIIYPNPSNGTIVVKGKLEEFIAGEDARLEIKTLLGQVLHAEKIKVERLEFEQPVTLPETANGIYLIQLVYGDQKMTGRITIAR